MGHVETTPLAWKLRRIAAGQRQLDVARATGLSATRYSGIERGEIIPTELESRVLDEHLPPLALSPIVEEGSKQELLRPPLDHRPGIGGLEPESLLGARR